MLYYVVLVSDDGLFEQKRRTKKDWKDDRKIQVESNAICQGPDDPDVDGTRNRSLHGTVIIAIHLHPI